jgi:hypothetical protein
MLRTGPRTQASGGAPERCGLSGSLAFDKIQDLDVQYYTPSSRSDKDIRCVTNLHRRMRAIVALSVLWGVLVASDIAADVAAVDAFLADNPKSLAVSARVWRRYKFIAVHRRELRKAKLHRKGNYFHPPAQPRCSVSGACAIARLRRSARTPDNAVLAQYSFGR